jgi:thioredoxin 1
MKLSIPVAVTVMALLAVGCLRQEAMGQGARTPSPTSVIVLDESNFDSQVQSGVILVDFWATWCGPCRMQGPVVEQVAKQVQGMAKVAKLDVNTAPKVAQRFKIRSIPTLIVFKDGKPEKEFVGVTKAETLVSAITAALDSE